MKEKFIIGTRESKLALWQAKFVALLLHQNGLETAIKPIKTIGDKVLNVSISKLGDKGVFTQAIEEELLVGTIDIAVHSAKDLPSDLGTNFEIIAFTQRIYPNDVVLSNHEAHNIYNHQKAIKIGTSATRRTALLKHYFPHVQPVTIRGNLHTRIHKMKEGHCDALLLSLAGVHAMKFTAMIVNVLPVHQFIPAVGQGAIAVQVAHHLPARKKALIRRCINHNETEINILAERAFLKSMKGGCSIPVFAMATTKKEELTIRGGVISLNGKQCIQEVLTDQKDNNIALGIQLANLIRQKGGKKIITEIKQSHANLG